MDERLKIVNNIIEISEQNKNPISIETIRLEFSSNKFSSKKNSIYHIIMNDKHLSKKDKYNIKYKCVSCGAIHIVGTTQFLRKVNKCSYRCNLCVNKDDVKAFNQTCEKDTVIDEKILTPYELKNESIRVFDEYDEDFKQKYFVYHITDDDYKRISKNIISLQNGKYKIEDLEYWPIFKTNNQMLFTSVFYDKKNNTIVKANQPILHCENCNNEWRAKTLEKYKNCYKILCPTCLSCNKTFMIRTTQNCIREKILYQSNLQLKFINWCNNNGIIVNNGPVISRKYRVGFMIKDILIDIKEMQIWYKNDIKTDKHQAKINAVKDLIKEGKYKEYYLITPDKWIYTLNKIKQNLNKI